MIARLRENIPLALLIGAALVIVALLGLNQWQRLHTSKAETRLATGQAGAALQSGADAVETIGNAHAAETQTHAIVKDGQDAINAAPAGDSNDAANRAACRLRSYRDQPRCIALLGPVAK